MHCIDRTSVVTPCEDSSTHAYMCTVSRGFPKELNHQNKQQQQTDCQGLSSVIQNTRRQRQDDGSDKVAESVKEEVRSVLRTSVQGAVCVDL